ncbi:FtsX-like permease family protein [Planctomycetaceae bacterium SH139]
MLRRTPLATKNLTHNFARTIVSIGGVMLAVVLMFMQLGFLGAVGDTATVVYQEMPAMDLVVRSPDYLHLFEPSSIDQSVALPLRGMGEVAEVRPLDTMLAAWRNPETKETRAIAVLGIDPEAPAVVTDELAGKIARLTSDEFVLVDRESDIEFVPQLAAPGSAQRFGREHIWTVAECNDQRVRIVETFKLGTGLAAAGAMVTSRAGFRRLSFGRQAERTSMLLIQLQPGVDPQAASQAIESRLASLGLGNLVVLQRQEVLKREIDRWYFETPIGLIFLMGVFLAVVVGSVICYMVLAAEVLANLAEYATLKAIGYSNRYLCGVLLRQALLVAGAAFLPALVVSQILYVVTSRVAAIPIAMDLPRAVIVAGLTALMCLVAGFIALRKLTKAEPASLF